MKKIISVALAAVLGLGLVSCSKSKDSKKLVIGATPVPHVELLSLVVDDLKAQGIDLDIREMNDYVVLNEALESGDLDANFDQHIPYMESTNRERGFHLVNAGGIHIEPFALYSKKYKSLDSIPDGATITIPNDPTNGGRALLLLQAAGFITLQENAGLEAVPEDIASNPKNLKISPVDAATLPRTLDDVDASTINGNYALDAGLTAKKDGLYVEGAESPYVNIIAVKDGNQNDERVTALVKALQSDKVKAYINEKYPNGEVVAVF